LQNLCTTYREMHSILYRACVHINCAKTRSAQPKVCVMVSSKDSGCSSVVTGPCGRTCCSIILRQMLQYSTLQVKNRFVMDSCKCGVLNHPCILNCL
jgi:hypothetical protein